MATEYRQRPGMGDHFDDEDLVMSSAQQRRNWRGILIALMVIIAVLAMIVTSVVLLTPPQQEELLDPYSDLRNSDRSGSDYYYNQRAIDELWWRRRGMRALRLTDILTDSANIKLFNGTWISGNELFCVTGSGDLAIMEIETDGTLQISRHLMSKTVLQKLKGPLVSFELSPDRNHVLIGHEAKKLHRYSKAAKYTVYTVSTEHLTPIMMGEHQYRNGTNHGGQQPYLLHAQWHKISTTADNDIDSMALIIVYRYDMFYVPWLLKLPITVEDTDNGKKNVTVESQTANATTKSPITSSTSSPDVNGENNSSSKSPWPHGPVRRITVSGSGATASSVGLVSNGIADYLYEMEILKRSPAVWPSSGRYLMYATFDDRRVEEYKYSVYMKGGQHHDKDDDNEIKSRSRQRKKKRRRRRIRRNARPDVMAEMKNEDETSEYYLYPEIRTLRYPKANTPNPVVTLSVIVNLDQLKNPQVQPKIRTLTPPPIFQYTDDYYFTAVQWVNDGGVRNGGGSHETDDDKSGASPAEVCVVWLNRAQNTSVTTLCKSPMWMCQVTQVINAVGTGGGDMDGVQGDDALGGNDRARRRYRRNGGGSQKHPSETGNSTGKASSPSQDDRHHRRQQHQHQHQHYQRGQRQHSGHHSRRRRAGDTNGTREGTRGRYGGWVDASVGGAGGGVASTGGGISDITSQFPPAAWWSTEAVAENFVGDDGYAGIAGVGDTATGAGYTVATLVRRGWETGDKELTPRAPVFAADSQGYVSVAPVRDEPDDDGQDRLDEGGVRLRRPSPKPGSQQQHGSNAKSRFQSAIGNYYAQVVAVNITKKLLAPLTFGEPDDDNNDGGNQNTKNKMNAATKSWTVVRILAWDQRTDMIYFLGVPSGRGAPHHRHLYTVKFTSATSSTAFNTEASNRAGYHYQQQNRKPIRYHNRNRPICLSCDVGSMNNIKRRKRHDVSGKQTRMDEARDDRLRQQKRERWENQKDDEKDNADEVATAKDAIRRQQRNRRRQKENMQNDGTMRHCTYYDAQFSRDGSHYALICLGPLVPYVTLHRIVENSDEDEANEDNIDGSGTGSNVNSTPQPVQKLLTNSSYSFEFVTLLENNTRLQDKYTNRVLLPGTRTFQLRLSGGRKLTTSGGLHFNDPIAAADYYSKGGDREQHFTDRKLPDSDPLTVAQVRLYLPLSVYDPEADPRPEFMSNHVNSGKTSSKTSTITSSASTDYNDSSSTTHSRPRRQHSTSHDNNSEGNNGSKRQRRQHKRQRHHRYKKLHPLLVVVNSDPGSQTITDRFSDRLGYTTGLLCSGSLDRTFPGSGDGNMINPKYNGNIRDHRRKRVHRNRRSSATRYYSSEYSNEYDYDSYDYNQDNDNNINNIEYVVAVIDPGRGTWARGYESLLALNYGDDTDEYENYSNGDDGESGGLLGTTDIRDQLEAVEYLLMSATSTGNSFQDDVQGYYSEDHFRGGRRSRDHSRWFSSPSQSNRRYYTDNDDYYDDEYDDNSDDNSNRDYYYYYYSNDGGNSDYGGSHEDDLYRDDNNRRSHRTRRSSSEGKENSETLRLPYVDANRVALLGGGPTSPSSPPSIYGGYAAARMALWQTIYGGAPIEKKSGESRNSRNRKEPVAIHSSFKCAITMAPVCSWRLYASTFSERYYGYFGGYDGSNRMSYDRSDLISFTKSFNESSYLPSSYGKGINLLVVHGTADTIIHPQHSMMLVRGVMKQQQQYTPIGLGRRHNNLTTPRGRIADPFPPRRGAIRISQLVMPDADLSSSRMATGLEKDSPIDHHHQFLHSIYSQLTQYLSTECFTNVRDGSRGRGFKIQNRYLRRRRRRWRTGSRDQETSDDQKQERREEGHQQNQRSDNNGDKIDFNTEDENDGSERNNGGRYRRHNIDSTIHTLENKTTNGVVVEKIKNDDHNFSDNNETNNINWGNSFIGNLNNHNSSNRKNNINEEQKKKEDSEDDENDEESEEEYDNGNDTDEERYESDTEDDDKK